MFVSTVHLGHVLEELDVLIKEVVLFFCAPKAQVLYPVGSMNALDWPVKFLYHVVEKHRTMHNLLTGSIYHHSYRIASHKWHQES